MLTEERIAEIEAAAKATLGELVEFTCKRRETAQFCTQSPNYVLALIAELRVRDRALGINTDYLLAEARAELEGACK